MIGEGSVERPYRESPFGRIVEVGWNAGGIVVVEVTTVETKFYEVATLTPPDELDDLFVGPEIHETDYEDKFILRTDSAGPMGTVVVQNALTVWIWDGFLHETIGDPGTPAAVAAASATFGYAPTLHLTGQQVKRNQQSPPFGGYFFGEVVNHTHPNGSQVTYRFGYIALSEGPQYDEDNQPFGHVSYASTDAYYWYRVVNIPEATAAILRKSYLVNFRKDFVRLAELRDVLSLLDSPLTWSIKGYAAGTSFTQADGAVTPIGGVLPKFSASGSVAGAHDGTIQVFRATGVVT